MIVRSSILHLQRYFVLLWAKKNKQNFHLLLFKMLGIQPYWKGDTGLKTSFANIPKLLVIIESCTLGWRMDEDIVTAKLIFVSLSFQR